MFPLTPDVVLPAAVILTMAGAAAAIGWNVLRSDPQHYENARRRTGSAKRAVLGLASPEYPMEMDGDVERGFALGYDQDRPFIVLNGKLPLDHVR